MAKIKEQKTLWAYEKSVPSDSSQLVLLNNVQFIYELALAQFELEALGAKCEITNSLREFKLLDAPDVDTLIKRLAYFRVVNAYYTDYFNLIQENRTRSVNQYLTHWIYPYKGKFHPQMIRALLNIIGLKKGDTMLDPFIGSGTAAVEAQLLGINCIGIEVSPLCVLQSRVKTEAIEAIQEIEGCKEDVFNKMRPGLFNPEGYNLSETIDSIPNEKVRNFYKMAELIAHSDKARRRKEFFGSFLKKSELMLASIKDYQDVSQKLNLDLGRVDIKLGDARQLTIGDKSVDGIITSPPYSIALDYISNDAHALKALGYDLPELREKFIGVRGTGSTKVRLYNEDLRESLKEMHRVLKPRKFCVIVIGNATLYGEELDTVGFTIDHCQKLGFHLVRNIDKIIFGLYNVMRRENILIFQKGANNEIRRSYTES